MSDLDVQEVASPVAGALAVTTRGHNLVYVAPPSPAWATPVLTGTLNRLQAEPRGPVLALCPAESVDEWARVAERLASGSGLRLAGAHAPGRLTRLLKADAVDLAFTTPETAHELVRRSALKMSAVSAVLLLWPEAWGGDDLLAALFQDLPKDTQRVVVTADSAGTASLVDRYCWRAPVVDVLGPDWADSPPAVRSAPVAWRRRLEVLGDLVEQLDPESLAIWVADQGDHDAIVHALAAAGTTATVTSDVPPRSALIIGYDLPVPSRLRELASVGELLLLVPPGTEPFVARLAPKRRPIHPRGLLDRAQAGLESSRRTVAGVLEQGAAPASYMAIAPLLERHEATAVAAALYGLWDAARTGAAEPAPAVARPSAAAVRLWVGIGRRDEVTPHDLVGSLVKECEVAREAVGRVEIRETFSIIELNGAGDPDRIAERMTGKMIRKRRLVARVDRGRPAGKERSRPS